MPEVGERYLFFLTHDFPLYGQQDDAFYLLTAYRLKDGKVSPLDFADGGTHPTYTRYKDKSESTLIADLTRILKVASNKQSGTGRAQ